MNEDVLHVVVGLVFDDANRVLIQQRTEPPEIAGLWEFPGGKIEVDETPALAVVRELDEEVGINVTTSEPFMRVRHAYPKKTVVLEVLEVTLWSGEARGREGQTVAWATIDELDDYNMLGANDVMVKALKRRELKST